MNSHAHSEERDDRTSLVEPKHSLPSDSDTLQVLLIGVLLAALVFGFVLAMMPGQALRG